MTWDATAALPVELSLFPNWFPFNIYELGSWARGTLMGLMMLQAARPEKKIDYQRGVLELYIEPPHFTKFKQPRGKNLLSLRNALNVADKALRFYDRHKIKSLRARALRHAENWLLEHQEANGSWGGIEPCYLLSAMALKANGYRNDHPVLEARLEASQRTDLAFRRPRHVHAVRLAQLGHRRSPARRCSTRARAADDRGD